MSLRNLSRLILLAVALFTALALSQLPHIRFDYDIEKFFPAGHEETLFYQQYQEAFGSDNDYVLIAIRPSGRVFDAVFLGQIHAFTEQLQGLSGVDSVLSPTNVIRQVRRPLSTSLREVPYLRWETPSSYQHDSSRIYQTPLLVGFLFSSNRKSVAIWVKHQEPMDTEGCHLLSKELREVLNNFSFSEVHIAGKCLGQSTFINIIQREVVLFTGLSLLVIVLFLWLSFRKLWGIIFPLMVVGITVMWTVGILTFQGKSIDVIGNLIPTILMVIGISDTIHFITHYLRNLQSGMAKRPALQQTIREVGLATLLTTFTTAIGFLTLTGSSFQSLVELGIYASIGLFFALGLTYSLLPSLLFLFKQKIPAKDQKSPWDVQLSRLFNWVMRNQRSILIGTAILILLGGMGATRVRINNYLLEDLKKSHPLQQDFRFFADNFSGVRPFEMQVAVKDSSKSIFDPDVLGEIQQVDEYLENTYGVKSLLSPVSVLKYTNQVLQYGSPRQYRLPEDSLALVELGGYVQSFFSSQQARSSIAEDGRSAKITGMMPDWGSDKVGKKDKALQNFLQQNFPDGPLHFHITGSTNLLDLNTRNLAWNVLLGLLIAVVIVGILMGLLVRSWSMVWVSLIPNLLPLWMIAGIMGFTGIDLKISTSIIFVISFGIAVDDSIHFLSRFRREFKLHPIETALRRTYLSTGKAIVSTSFILSGGFLVLCFSDFLGTFYIGLLIAVTLLMALLADLILLPVLLYLFFNSSSS